ncbi:hypothetical protein H7J93_16455 [Mycobacterium barrassiae]|uniref:hypothetical protein n=1 Tax=Mycobacterium barrassiae TaxID=319709 RepID=UPI002265F744|nr:hypothetical protein [Mycobacterium barrassiae]MCV7301212.1 hypothetical protein [Mycobacterium barrassiae]
MPVAKTWFDDRHFDGGIRLITERHAHSYVRCNIWHIRGVDRDLVVDAGLGVSSLRAHFPALFESEPELFLTHAHLDHIGGAHQFTVCYAHRAESAHSPQPGSLRRDELIALLELDVAEPEVVAMPDVLIDALPDPNFDVHGPTRGLAAFRCGGFSFTG